jgi:hypothetical protein
VNNDVSENAPVITPHKLPIEKDLSDFIYESIDASSFINVNAWCEFFDAVSAGGLFCKQNWATNS